MAWLRGMAMALCAVLVGSVMGQGAATQRGEKEIQADMDAVEAKMKELVPEMEKLNDVKFRKENGAKIAPLMMQLANLHGEMAAVKSGFGKAMQEAGRYTMLYMAMAMGDKEAERVLTEMASREAEPFSTAKMALTLGNWLKHADAPKAQQKMLDDFVAVVKANPEDTSVAGMLRVMAQTAANKEISDKVVEVIKTNLKEELAKSVIAQLDAEKAKKNIESKPQGK